MRNPIELADLVSLHMIFFKSKIRLLQVENQRPDYMLPYQPPALCRNCTLSFIPWLK
jgi:hypothetical protein